MLMSCFMRTADVIWYDRYLKAKAYLNNKQSSSDTLCHQTWEKTFSSICLKQECNDKTI